MQIEEGEGGCAEEDGEVMKARPFITTKERIQKEGTIVRYRSRWVAAHWNAHTEHYVVLSSGGEPGEGTTPQIAIAMVEWSPMRYRTRRSAFLALSEYSM